MAENTNSKAFTIAYDHPSLAGHFPGNPIVPGVVILDQVIRIWQKNNQQKNPQVVTTMQNAKFINILHAEITCSIRYTKKNTQKIDFVVLQESSDKVICKGTFSQNG